MKEMMRPDARGPLDFSALREIAVFRALQLGDLLCVVPALRALRAAAPQARITLVGLPWAESFVQRFHRYLDELLVFPGFPGLPESAPQLDKIPDFFARAQARRFDLATQLHGSGGLSNPLMVALGAARNAGFYAEGQYCPDTALFTHWADQEHEVLRYVHLMEFLGVPPQGTHLEFPLIDEDYDALSAAWPEWKQADDYVCIHPGARLPSRRWPPERFARVADGLAEQGLRVVLTGSDSERDIIDAVRRTMEAPSLDLSGRTSLGSLAALVSHARLVVCNDTGMSHVAAGVATPSVVVSSGADPHRWAPLNAARHRFLYADAPCRPCAHVVCPIGHPCALNVKSEQVLDEALALCCMDPHGISGGTSTHPAPARPSSQSRPATLQGN
jgi:ADP-heptose:LPS heptosyltransferase